jgi:hypothetical protein
MPETLTYLGNLTIVTCWCGMKHAVPAELRSHQLRRHENGQREVNIYCPLGHYHFPAGEPKVERLRRQRDAALDREALRGAERDQAEASARAYKGAATKARKRAKAGVCPCCNRTFKQLTRHMESKHPEFDPGAVEQSLTSGQK